MKIAALYVVSNGIYFGRIDVEPWDEKRDARRYLGPLAVVAHPPCQRWGRYWSGGPSSRKVHAKGKDSGCFASAIAAVRRWGGVLEHPEASHAWPAFELAKPPRAGGWVRADAFGGFTCCVEQGHYGHRARKATWLYAVDVELPELRWGSSLKKHVKLDVGFHSIAERRLFMKPPSSLTEKQRRERRVWLDERAKRLGKDWCCPERLNKSERVGTPRKFAELLISIASTRDAYVARMRLERQSRRQIVPARWLESRV